MCLTRSSEVVNATISRNALQKNASGVARQMNKPWSKMSQLCHSKPNFASRLQWGPPAYGRGSDQKPGWGWPVVPVPRDTHWRWDGKEDTRPGQKHQVGTNQTNTIKARSIYLLTLVGIVSSDVTRSGCTTSFTPCCSIFSQSYISSKDAFVHFLMLSMYCILERPLLVFPGIISRRHVFTWLHLLVLHASNYTISNFLPRRGSVPCSSIFSCLGRLSPSSKPDLFMSFVFVQSSRVAGIADHFFLHSVLFVTPSSPRRAIYNYKVAPFFCASSV